MRIKFIVLMKGLWAISTFTFPAAFQQKIYSKNNKLPIFADENALFSTC
jgi:hypothetical protein